MQHQISEIRDSLREGRTVMGLELGSTRIKCVLIDETHTPIASGSYEWENRYENQIWTYPLEEVWAGIQESYRRMAKEVEEKYSMPLIRIGAMGFSAMMHGYLVFDQNDELLTPFRTWRNTMTAEASARLTEVFSFPIAQRWSIAHLYQAILNGEEHVDRIAFQTTLAGYVHWKLTGRKVLGVGEASGMFPIDSATGTYHAGMMDQFAELVADRKLPWKLADILPEVLPAGADAGTLTESGARLLDPTGTLLPGAACCPPEGDAGTGMAATNSVAERTGNVSAGTSVFAMIVLEQDLKELHPELDMVTTPDGRPVAMVHCNNCTSELNAWVGLFSEFAKMTGANLNQGELYGMLFRKALEGAPDGGGLLAYNYLSGEHITGLSEGRPLFVRSPESQMNLADFMRVQLFSALATLKIGLDILRREEGVAVEEICGHGGFFKTPEVGQRLMAAAIDAPVAVRETAGEGGPWGAALLAAYRIWREPGETLGEYLSNRVFAEAFAVVRDPDPEDVAGFEAFLARYKEGLSIERTAVEHL